MNRFVRVGIFCILWYPLHIYAHYIVTINDPHGGVTPEIKYAKYQFGNVSIMILNEEIFPYTVENVDVIDIEEDRKVTLFHDCISQTISGSLWGLVRIQQRGRLDSVHMEGVQYSYSLDENQSDVYVYVIDSGVLTDHFEFEDRAKWLYTVKDVANEGDYDEVGHGTHVAGIIAGVTYGVAKKVNILAVKMLNKYGEGSLVGLIESLDFVVNHCHHVIGRNHTQPKCVINLALGIHGPSSSLTTAVQHAINSGITVVAAAGNSQGDACQWLPAAIPDVITVAAVDDTDRLAEFSNHGNCIDILAPGVAILSAGNKHTNDSSVRHGTSMAAPFATGVIARYLSQQYQKPSCLSAYLKSQATSDLIRPPDTPGWLLYTECHTSFKYQHACLDEPSWTYKSFPAMLTLILTIILCILFILPFVMYYVYQSRCKNIR